MNIEARVSKLSDLLGKKFDTFCILAEDDGLIDVQLGEERVQAVQFLSFLQVGVELGDSLERELLHQIYEFGVWHILLLERSNGHWVSSWEKRNLLILWHDVKDFADNNLEIIWK